MAPDMEMFVSLCADMGADMTMIRREAARELAIQKHAPVTPSPMEQRWYASLAAGTPDWDHYLGDEYLAHGWGCWQGESRKYLRLLARSRFASPPPKRVADLGCGIGWSTAELCRMFPDAEVVGTNLLASRQAELALRMRRRAGLGFRLVEDLAEAGQCDLVFASEYFEHFPAPGRHLAEVLAGLRPRVLAAASTWTHRAAGHFNAYQFGSRTVPGAQAARLFGKQLKTAGYRKQDTGFWNGRPGVWLREEAGT